MNKKRLAILIIAVVFVSVVATFLLTGCDKEKHEEFHVSSVEDFENIEGDIVILDNDIDFGNRKLDHRLNIYEFRGNGHTISNVMLDDSFFANVFIISDLTFDGLTLNKNTPGDSAFVLSNTTVGYRSKDSLVEAIFTSKDTYGVKISNVHVKNSTAVVAQTDNPGAFGGIVGANPDSIYYNEKPSITGCSVDNISCTIEGGKTTNFSVDYTTIKVGGIVGSAYNIAVESCSVSNSEFNVTSLGVYNDISLGAVIGNYVSSHSENVVKSCYSYNNELKAKATWSASNAVNNEKSTPEIMIGGMASVIDTDNDCVMSSCYAENNNIDINCVGKYTVGGLVATLDGIECKESYALNNSAVASGRNTVDTAFKDRIFGGLVGKTTGTITSSYAYGNSISDAYINENLDAEDGDERYFGGFVGQAIGSVISYCASGNNVMTGAPNTKSFCSGKDSKAIFETCYSDVETNITTIITAEEFKDLNVMIEKMLLTDSRWVSGNGKPPVLSLK